MTKALRDVFVVDAVRTPVGRHGGALAGVRPDDLAAIVIRELVRRVGGAVNPVSGIFTTHNGTATNGLDFEGQTNTVSFRPRSVARRPCASTARLAIVSGLVSRASTLNWKPCRCIAWGMLAW